MRAMEHSKARLNPCRTSVFARATMKIRISFRSGAESSGVVFCAEVPIPLVLVALPLGHRL